MSKVTITLEDTPEGKGFDLKLDADPPVDADKDMTPSQRVAAGILYFIEENFASDTEEGD